MKALSADRITEAVARLCVVANTQLPPDVRQRIESCRKQEGWPAASAALDDIIQNYQIAEQQESPICQDTGMACVFLEIGQDIHIDGDLAAAVDAGVRRGYADGYLRKSVVGDPLRRVNTGDNTPAMLYTELVPGDKIGITVAPKGFGSENMSRVAMLKPADGVEGVRRFVVETVALAGGNPCPPVVVGVGLGGTFDKAALLAKKALLRAIGTPGIDEYYTQLENRLLDEINALGIGPQGFGGRTTALAVHIETLPAHIAGLPCAVNISCHVTRHASEVIE